jgi:hypothetical protein
MNCVMKRYVTQLCVVLIYYAMLCEATLRDIPFSDVSRHKTSPLVTVYRVLNQATGRPSQSGANSPFI